MPGWERRAPARLGRRREEAKLGLDVPRVLRLLIQGKAVVVGRPVPAILSRSDMLLPRLVDVFAIMGLKELGETARKELILDLAPDHEGSDRARGYE